MSQPPTKPVPIELQLPLPPKRAAETLCQRIVEHLVTRRPPVGTELFSEAQLMELAGVSRSTVRRALEPLERTGWIERRQGRGTYAGPRVAMATADGVGGAASNQTTSVVRIGVVADPDEPWKDDPYSRSVVTGLDSVADQCQVAIELFGHNARRSDAIVRRLQNGPPDVLAVLTPHEQDAVIVGLAQLLKIPCIGTGDSAIPFNIPTVSYDDEQGAVDAVRYLHDQGHRRIGMVMTEATHTFVFHRRRGYYRGLREIGLPIDQNLALWLPQFDAVTDETPSRHVDLLRTFLHEQKPTAVLVSEGKLMAILGALYRAGEIAVPQQLSILAFGMLEAKYARWFSGMIPTVVRLPLQQVGGALAALARKVVTGEPHDMVTRLPCWIEPGESVAGPME